MIKLRSFGTWMKCNANIALLCFFLLPIMLEIILCCNRDVIPTWCVRKSISQLTHFEKNYIFARYGWYEFYINRHVNHSISRSNPVVKTSNKKFKWKMDVNVWTCWYDVYEYTYEVFILWRCHIMKLYEVRITKVLVV
jgi:hypothetical protein